MTEAIVNELPRRLEPVTNDPFIDGLDSGNPRARERQRTGPQERSRSPMGQELEPRSRALSRADEPAPAAVAVALGRSTASLSVTTQRHHPSRTSSIPLSGVIFDVSSQLVALVSTASGGDQIAWTELVRCFDRMMRAVARSYRLSQADVDDVVQATWLRLLQDIDKLREPDAVAGWLMTATRRQAMRVLQVFVHEQLTDDPELGDRADTDQPDECLLAAEQREARALSARCPTVTASS